MAGPHGELVFAPLGGVGEIGMNLSLYGLGDERRRTWLVVDVGVSFASEENLPGIDLILPDIRFIAEERRNLAGIVLTHAHEDHFGALLDLWPKLKVPVYATPFTAALLEAKRLGEPGAPEIPVTIVQLGSRFNVGPFDIELATVAHSIPESNALIIRTPHGAILHTGDWKLDPTPVIGAPTDEAKLKGLGEEGCLALIGDFNQRGARRALALRSRCGSLACRTDRERAWARRRHDVCLQRRPHSGRGGCCTGGGSRGDCGRPGHGPDRAGRARNRLSGRCAGLPRDANLRSSAARQGRGALHREPG